MQLTIPNLEGTVCGVCGTIFNDNSSIRTCGDCSTSFCDDCQSAAQARDCESLSLGELFELAFWGGQDSCNCPACGSDIDVDVDG
jgi:hypothetical protein